MTAISILIPVYNQIHFTKQVIQSIKDNISGAIDYEVIILDNGSTDGTGEFLRDLDWHRLKVIDLENNIYVNPAWSMLAKEAMFENLLFLNNDITLFKDFDRKLLSYHSSGRITCPATCQYGDNVCFRQTTNINGTCFMISKKDYIEIPYELKCWYGDDILFRSVQGVKWIDEHVVHWGSQTLNKIPELNEILNNDAKEYVKYCKEKEWKDDRFPETFEF